MLYKLGFVWKWSDLELSGENPRFWVKIAQGDDIGRRRGLARGSIRAATRTGDCPRNAFFIRFSFGVFLVGII